jgi:hypothetical protein
VKRALLGSGRNVARKPGTQSQQALDRAVSRCGVDEITKPRILNHLAPNLVTRYYNRWMQQRFMRRIFPGVDIVSSL